MLETCDGHHRFSCTLGITKEVKEVHSVGCNNPHATQKTPRSSLTCRHIFEKLLYRFSLYQNGSFGIFGKYFECWNISCHFSTTSQLSLYNIYQPGSFSKLQKSDQIFSNYCFCCITVQCTTHEQIIYALLRTQTHYWLVLLQLIKKKQQ